MGHDFLDGIDEHFERLIENGGNGGRNTGTGRRRSNGASRDQFLRDIVSAPEPLAGREKNAVLEFIQKLNQR